MSWLFSKEERLRRREITAIPTWRKDAERICYYSKMLLLWTECRFGPKPKRRAMWQSAHYAWFHTERILEICLLPAHYGKRWWYKSIEPEELAAKIKEIVRSNRRHEDMDADFKTLAICVALLWEVVFHLCYADAVKVIVEYHAILGIKAGNKALWQHTAHWVKSFALAAQCLSESEIVKTIATDLTTQAEEIEAVPVTGRTPQYCVTYNNLVPRPAFRSIDKKIPLNKINVQATKPQHFYTLHGQLKAQDFIKYLTQLPSFAELKQLAEELASYLPDLDASPYVRFSLPKEHDKNCGKLPLS